MLTSVTYKSRWDLTIACELPLRRKDDWPAETMVRSCLYTSFSSSWTDWGEGRETRSVRSNREEPQRPRSETQRASITLTSSAVQRGLVLYTRAGDEVCVGLCTTLIGKVFSYMLVQGLRDAPPKLHNTQQLCDSKHQQSQFNWITNLRVRPTLMCRAASGCEVCLTVGRGAAQWWRREARWRKSARWFLAHRDAWNSCTLVSGKLLIPWATSRYGSILLELEADCKMITGSTNTSYLEAKSFFKGLTWFCCFPHEIGGGSCKFLIQRIAVFKLQKQINERHVSIKLRCLRL